ncbi:MAG: hypothetical protein LBS63_05500 [Prevotellaceae bacterium]|jgi:hypothetical protein|nr:hypothetical protein [Prevotellaceae bacterium]
MKKVFSFALALALAESVVAQAPQGDSAPAAPPAKVHKLGMALVPQAIFYDGLRVDVQPYLTPQHQLVIAPQFYYAKQPSSLYSEKISKLQGVGLELDYRVFPNKGKTLYCAAGLNYNYYRAEYMSVGMYQTGTENGLPLYEYGEALNEQTINRVGASVMMGLQVGTLYGFFFDLYAGMGFRYSAVGKKFDDSISFDNGMWDVGYTGTYLVLGFKLGIDL